MRHRHLWLTHADGLDTSVALRIHTLKLQGTSTPRMMQVARWCNNLQTLHLLSKHENLRWEDTRALLALRNPHLHSLSIHLHMVVMDRNALLSLVDAPGWLCGTHPSAYLRAKHTAMSSDGYHGHSTLFARGSATLVLSGIPAVSLSPIDRAEAVAHRCHMGAEFAFQNQKKTLTAAGTPF